MQYAETCITMQFVETLSAMQYAQTLSAAGKHTQSGGTDSRGMYACRDLQRNTQTECSKQKLSGMRLSLHFTTTVSITYKENHRAINIKVQCAVTACR